MPSTTTPGIRKVRCGTTGHRYIVDGKNAVGVTDVLKLAIGKPSLMQWAALCAAEEAVEIIGRRDGLDAGWRSGHLEFGSLNALKWHLVGAHERHRDGAAARGTKVHKYAEKMIGGDPVDVPQELLGYVQNCARFMDEWKVAPLLKERVVGHHRWGYGGTFDLVAALPDGRRVLFDYKTGTKVRAETKLQLAAYRHAEAYVTDDGLEVPMSEVGITESKVVHLSADRYDVVPMASGDAEFKIFLHALQVTRFVKAQESWVPEPEQVRL